MYSSEYDLDKVRRAKISHFFLGAMYWLYEGGIEFEQFSGITHKNDNIFRSSVQCPSL